MSCNCENIIDEGLCYIYGDTYQPEVLEITREDGNAEDLSKYNFKIDIKNINGNIVKLFTMGNGLSLVDNKLVISYPKYFDIKKGEYTLNIGYETETQGMNTVASIRLVVVDKRVE